MGKKSGLEAENAAEFARVSAMLPAGSEFPVLRAKQQIYVDKTEKIFALASNHGGCYFLARPHGFGKTTLVSTFEELFIHGTAAYNGHPSYFKGLYIDGRWDEAPGAYNVVRLDFKGFCQDGQSSAVSFEESLKNTVRFLAQSLHLELNPEYADDLGWMFGDLLKKCADNSLVVLIDNYDAPLTCTHTAAEYEAVLDIMQGFFAYVKSYCRKFRFVFITGITRFQDSSVFSVLDFIDDISYEPIYADICGFGMPELNTYFADNLRCAAALRWGMPYAEVSTDELSALNAYLMLWWEGCYFGKDAQHAVLSPGSVLSFFRNAAGDFCLDQAKAESDLQLLAKNILYPRDLLQVLNAVALRQDIIVTKKNFFMPGPVQNMNFNVLLYQCGCLTFKVREGIEENNSPFIHLRLPNYEAASSLPDLMLKLIFSGKDAQTELAHCQARLTAAVQLNDIRQLRLMFTQLLASAVRVHPQLDLQSSGAAVLGFFLLSCNFSICAAYWQMYDCFELCAVSDRLQKRLVLEFKFCSDPKDGFYKALQQALEQLKGSEYAQSELPGQKVLRMALVYSAPDKSFVQAAVPD
ncbi:MAG: AAA family ATPase [Proteobacteria bacterium]|uniref:AAA family ATPase n=1 Tax=Candidatus Avisuccinivibrio stercorigallinarum TaxID=2840704 RepID=A0A9D9D9P8_9GAMM|nr:AAA family ATPase [Candidatus Avisuccinivibrio stercorigallinarum]